jgi:hypothetical protein
MVNGGGAPVQVLDAGGNPALDAGGNPVYRKFDLAQDCLAIGDPADPRGHMMRATSIAPLATTASRASVAVR